VGAGADLVFLGLTSCIRRLDLAVFAICAALRLARFM